MDDFWKMFKKMLLMSLFQIVLENFNTEKFGFIKFIFKLLIIFKIVKGHSYLFIIKDICENSILLQIKKTTDPK